MVQGLVHLQASELKALKRIVPCTGEVFLGDKIQSNIEPLFYPVEKILILENIFLLSEDLQVISADNEITIVNIFQ